MLFESKEYLKQVAKAIGMDEGLGQTGEKLITYYYKKLSKVRIHFLQLYLLD